MKNVLLFILFVTVLCNALSLEQIQADLKKNMITSDSVEIGIRTSVSSPLISNVQGVSVYLVRKGNAKIFAELKMPLVNQRTIVNGNRMKTINLNTRESQVLPYDGESLKAHSYTNFNPLASGEWGEPKFVSENLYSIKGDKGTLYYNSKKKRIEKIETEEKDKFVLTDFSYDVENNLKTMTVHVSAQGVETTIVTEILKLRHS